MSLLVRGAHQVATPLGKTARRGPDFTTLSVQTGAVVRCDDGLISFVGDEREHDQKFPPPNRILDADGGSAILEAHSRTHGARVLPHFKFDKAKVIVSLGADFLGTWISPVEFTHAWRTQRVPTVQQPQMSTRL